MMNATCLICGEILPGADNDRIKRTVLIEHVLRQHPERVQHRGPLLMEALGCFSLRPSNGKPDTNGKHTPNGSKAQTAAAPAGAAAAAPQPVRAAGKPAGPVLVVEDNDDVREAMLALIQSAGFRVRGAENGQHALEMLHDGSELPSLIVLDLMMPVMNGLEFRQRQLADPNLKQIPVVVVTAYGNAIDRRRFSGAEVLGKPIELDRMLDVVRERCVRASPAAQPA